MAKKKTTSSFVEAYRTLLTVEEERALFERWHKSGSNDDLTEIVTAYSPIIVRTIKELSGYNADREELTSEGLIALVESAKRFELSRGLRFSTYAKTWVRGIMLGYITKNYFMVNVCTSHNKKKLFFSLRKLIAMELTKHGSFELDTATANEMAVEHAVEPEIVFSIYDMIRMPYLSLSEPTNDEDEQTREYYIPSETPQILEVISEMSGIKFHKKLISDAMDRVLDDREKRIFKAQVLTSKDDHQILETLGKEFDITKERVRQIRNTAMEKVTKEIRRYAEINSLSTEDIF